MIGDLAVMDQAFLLGLAGLLAGTGVGWFLVASIVAAIGRRG